MMNLKSLNGANKSGFMLTEVLIALAIVALLTTPVSLMISNALRASARSRDEITQLLVMKNLMVQQTYEAAQSKEQTRTRDQKVDDPPVVLKYTQGAVRSMSPFSQIPQKELQNLCRQEVTASFDRRKEQMVRFLYKPRQ